MSQPIVGRIEQLTHNPGHDFFTQQKTSNDNLLKRLSTLEERFDNDIRTLSASIAAVWGFLTPQDTPAESKFDREEFERLVKPLIEFLQTKCHPHMPIIVEYNRASLVEEIRGYVPD